MTPIRFLIVLLAVSIPAYANSQEADVEKLKFKYTTRICVHYLDSYLSLNQKQQVALGELLKRKWTPVEISNSLMLFWSGYDSGKKVFESLKDADLKRILSDEQLLQWESMRENSLSKAEQIKYLRGLAKASVDPIKAFLDQATVLEVQRLSKLLGLDEKQALKLRVAAKGAIKEVLAQRQDYLDRLTDGDLNIVEARGFVLDKVAVEGPVFRIQKMKLWNATLENVLTEQQYAIHLNDQTARSLASKRISSHWLALSYFHKRDKSVDDYRTFTELIENGIAEAQEGGQIEHHGSMIFEVVEVFMNLDDERIQKSVTPDTWRKITPILDRLRKRNRNDQE